MSAGQDKKTTKILCLGLAFSVALIGIDLFALAPKTTSLPQGVAASVNGRTISMEQYGRALASFEADRREPTRVDDRAHLLERLIEEELLVQRGIAIGLPTHDATVRSTIVQSMIETMTAKSRALEPSETDLQSYYQDNQALFAPLPQLHIRAYRFASTDLAWEALNGALQMPTADPLVPDGRLPSFKLREYIGPTAMQVALRLSVGDISEPISSPSGVLIIELIHRSGGVALPLDQIRDQVLVAYQISRDEQSLRETLTWLKNQAEISTIDTD